MFLAYEKTKKRSQLRSSVTFSIGKMKADKTRFRSLIDWIQPIKLRKREFDRLEKIQQFYQLTVHHAY